MAPESFLGKPATETIDHYSFSIIMWELLARTMLLFMRTKKVEHYKVEYVAARFRGAARAMERDGLTDIRATGHRYTPKLWATDAAAGVRPEQPEAWPPALRQLMRECWSADPEERPSMKVVMDRLEQMLEPQKFTDPTKKGAAAGADGGCCALQ